MGGDIWKFEAILVTAEADNVTPFGPQITSYVYVVLHQHDSLMMIAVDSFQINTNWIQSTELPGQ